MTAPLDSLRSLKVKLGSLVAASVLTAALLTLLGSWAGVPSALVLPVVVALSLGVTQLLAAGMVEPLRQMTVAARGMARGDYDVRVRTSATDEVGELAAAFNTMAADLATVDRERRDLIATVSHELRTPLTAMTARLENLADGVVPADEAHLREALVQAERLRDLVSDLLDLSRLEAGVTSLAVQELELAAFVRERAEQVDLHGGGDGFVLDVPEGVVVRADPARLGQLVLNVLDNARRHSPPDQPVRVSARSRDAAWQLDVADAGAGIDPADRERVFERFGTDSAGGTGLGLAIARWVAELHGGTLRFVDPPGGVGTLVRLDVPHVAARRPASPLADTGSAATRPGPRVGEPSGPPATDVTSPVRGVDAGLGGPAPATPETGMDALFGRFWPETVRRGGGAVLAAAAAGVFAGFALSFTLPGVSWTAVLVAAGAAALSSSRRRSHPWTIACSVLAVLLVLPLTLLDAEWTGVLGVLAAAAVFLCGIVAPRSLSGIVVTGLSWPAASLRGLPWFGRSLQLTRLGGRAPAVLRTLVWSVLALAVFGTLFASADALFASWVDVLVPNLTFGTAVARGFVACAVFALTLAAAYLAANPPRVDLVAERRPTPLARRFEWLVPVLVVDLVFAAFLAAQAAAVFGGHGYVEDTTGLTYADYVHQGFGQLTVATALTLLVVWAASRRASTDPADQWWLRGSLGLLCGLTLVVVWSALYRMHVYQEAYGFTTLRVFVDVFEGWLGVVVLAVMVLGAAGRGGWLPRFALVSGAVALLGLAASSPDAWVATRNIDRYEATGRLDLGYLMSLSDDATPVIVERLPDDVAACVLRSWSVDTTRNEALADPRAWNLGRERASRALEEVGTVPEPSGDADPCAPVWQRFAEDEGDRIG